MTHNGKITDITQVTHVFHHLLGVLDLIRHRHILKLTLTLAMTVEVEADRGDAMLLQAVGDQFKQRTILRAAEAMTEDHHRTFLTIFQHRLLNDGCQLTMIAIDGDTLLSTTLFARSTNTSLHRLMQQLINLICQHR